MTGYIAVGTDGSDSSATAVKWAAEDAARRGCGLTVVHVCESWIYDVPYQPVPLSTEGPAGYCEGVLQAAVELARVQAPGIEVTTRMPRGRVTENLLKESESAIQVVVGSRGLGGFTGLLAGSVSIGLAGHAACPVVVVREVPETSQGKIVVGFDGSPHAQAALDYAFEEARRRDTTLEILYAWQLPLMSSYAAGYAIPMDDLFKRSEDAIVEALSPWIDKYPDVHTTKASVSDHPVSALSEASKHADLVVVGSRGLGGFGAAILGSISRGVLHHAHCPVAVVPAPS
ncbi:Nucleotide-binding universal stress protein, UspA family [Sinosporangium album]|uniref:Nucleotide-binding universal stress protein, UspA family n=1 Tax=Sinosporangium album TaxID=504805 RepID=A0A1G8BT05_9ACTN|nr:universal stress protein [Sinosporangium album]SDH36214.1 Nucleotide-binding universal stress protein, UspA family [Sinosporangium album]